MIGVSVIVAYFMLKIRFIYKIAPGGQLNEFRTCQCTYYSCERLSCCQTYNFQFELFWVYNIIELYTYILGYYIIWKIYNGLE